MTDHLPPEQLDELLAGYALGDLSPEEAETLQQQLAETPAWRRRCSNSNEFWR
jgi:hypothetical protein